MFPNVQARNRLTLSDAPTASGEGAEYRNPYLRKKLPTLASALAHAAAEHAHLSDALDGIEGQCGA